MKRNITTCIIVFVLIILSACSPKYDYALHKPKVLYDKPSRKAMHKMLGRTLGKDYRWAEEGPDKFDCSGLVYYCYASMNKEVPRTAREQAKIGKTVSPDELKYGDLLFFDTTAKKTGAITHVGIYVGDGKFQHASNERNGVKISSLNDPYYRSRLRICKRYIPEDENVVIEQKHKLLTPHELFADIKKKYPSITMSSAECESCYAVPAKVTSARGSYYIQIGSFSGYPDSAYLSHLKAAGFDYKVVDENGMKKLLAGPFESEEEANSVLPTVKREFSPEAFVRRKD